MSARILPGARRMLEWGMATDHPGSLCLDAKRRPVFTGSVVCSVNFELLRGRVVELLDERRVSVLWDEDAVSPNPVVLSPAALLVLEALPRG